MDFPKRYAQYSLLKRVASGIYTDTYVARRHRDETRGHEFAIKRLYSDLAKNDEVREQFTTWSRWAARFSHPGIAAVFEVNEVSTSKVHTCMEYVWGEDLRRIAERGMTAGRFLPLSLAVKVVSLVAEALEYCHAESDPLSGKPFCLCQDLSPSNIAVGYDGRVAILDFGPPFDLVETWPGIRPDPLMGKIAYLSPEQVGGGDVDPRSNLFSLGILLYELTARKRLFKASRAEQIKEMIRQAKVPEPGSATIPYPPELQQIVAKALAREPEQRYQHASELRRELEQFLSGKDTETTPDELGAYVQGVFADKLAETRSLLGDDYHGPNAPEVKNHPWITSTTTREIPRDERVTPSDAILARTVSPPPLPPFPTLMGSSPQSPPGGGKTGDTTEVPFGSAKAAPPARIPSDDLKAVDTARAPSGGPKAAPVIRPPSVGAKASDADRTPSGDVRAVRRDRAPSGGLRAVDGDRTPAGGVRALDTDRAPSSGPETVDAEPSEPPHFEMEETARVPYRLSASAGPVQRISHTLRRDHPDEFEKTARRSSQIAWILGITIAGLALAVFAYYIFFYQWPWEGLFGRRAIEPIPAVALEPPRMPETTPVLIQSTPTGAQVAINGVMAPQTTPYTYALVPAATNSVALFLDGFETTFLDVDLTRPFGDEGITNNLEPIVPPPGWVPPPPTPEGTGLPQPTMPRGRLNVTSRPAGATILLNGQPACQSTPCEIDVPASQEQHLSAHLADHLDTIAFVAAPLWEHHLDTKYVEFELTPLPQGNRLYTYLQIDSVPSGARVSINDERVGRTPLNVSRSISQLIRVQIEADDHEPWKRSYYPSPGQIRIAPVLTPIEHEMAQLSVIVDAPDMPLTRIYIGPNEVGVDQVAAVPLEVGTVPVTLSYTPPPDAADPSRRRSRLDVELPAGRHVTVRYRWNGLAFELVERLEEPAVFPAEGS